MSYQAIANAMTQQELDTVLEEIAARHGWPLSKSLSYREQAEAVRRDATDGLLEWASLLEAAETKWFELDKTGDRVAVRLILERGVSSATLDRIRDVLNYETLSDPEAYNVDILLEEGDTTRIEYGDGEEVMEPKYLQLLDLARDEMEQREG